MRNLEPEANQWIYPDEDYCFYLHMYKNNNAIATVTKLENEKWIWEVFEENAIIVDMDGWWGIKDSCDEAKLEAEKYLNLI